MFTTIEEGLARYKDAVRTFIGLFGHTEEGMEVSGSRVVRSPTEDKIRSYQFRSKLEGMEESLGLSHSEVMSIERECAESLRQVVPV